MLGAIIGDIIGSRYEHWQSNVLSKDFPLFDDSCRFTDDTVMTLGTIEACLAWFKFGGEETASDRALVSGIYKKWCRKFPNRGFGRRTRAWFNSDAVTSTKPSFANGAAMRISPVAWFSVSLEQTEAKSKVLSEITHDADGTKGAMAIAAATFMAIEREGGDYMSPKSRSSKEEIKGYLEKAYGYNLSIALSEAESVYKHTTPRRSQADKSVPAAILAFLRGKDFEDVIRTAISLGGDSDTIAAMAGGIAEAYYEIPVKIKERVRHYVSPDLYERIQMFERERMRFSQGKYLLARDAAQKVCMLSLSSFPETYTFGPSAWQCRFDCETPEAERAFWGDVVYWSNYLFRVNDSDLRPHLYAKLLSEFNYFACLMIGRVRSDNDLQFDSLFAGNTEK
jgi:ADP-ribosylglycohydrolase